MYTLLCRHARCSLLTSQHLSDTELANYKRRSSVGTTPKIRTLLEKSESLKKALLLFVMLGSSMVMGDGILTPAISGNVHIPVTVPFASGPRRKHASRG